MQATENVEYHHQAKFDRLTPRLWMNSNRNPSMQLSVYSGGTQAAFLESFEQYRTARVPCWTQYIPPPQGKKQHMSKPQS
mmetsp:Transcript_5612/g.11257  ORF Transcript_5612/g.11257 Transcript_5612/m.11257 type:complete len:80 (+) Transcript_5612:334-573(+)